MMPRLHRGGTTETCLPFIITCCAAVHTKRPPSQTAMSSEKPNFLSQPVVKSVFMFRNGDPYYEARRIVINQKRVSNFETLLREVTGGVQAPFGAVRNIYTPRGGHKVDCLESLKSGEQYVAAGREKFKRLDYQQIGSRRKRMMQTLPMQAKPLPQNRIIASARFLKPIKEPCTIFVAANGDVLNPTMRLLIHQRMLGQFDRILEMITEKMGLRVLGGVRSLYTYEGHQVTDGNQLESGQLYVAVGREKFKKLPYSDLLFTKPRGIRRVNGMKAYSLPPIYRFSKQNGNGKSTIRSSDSADGDSKDSPPRHNGSNKEHLSSIVREISQARLISLRKKKSGQSMTLSISDNADSESKADDGNTEDKTPQDQLAEAKPADDDTKAAEESGEKAEESEEAAAEHTTEDASTKKEEKEENQETNGEEEVGEEKKESDEQNAVKQGEAVAGSEEKEEEVEGEVKEEVRSEEQGSSSSNGDKIQDSIEKEDGSHTSSEHEKDEQEKNTEEEKQDKDSGRTEKSSEEQVNDGEEGEKQKETENSNDQEKTQSDNETKENNNSRSSSSNSYQEEDLSKTKEGATKESEEEEKNVNGEVSGEDDEVESEAELDMEEENSASQKDATVNGDKGEDGDSDSQDKSKKESD
uniref:doublecortin domain-containing protein 2-like isoform X5 n=1 Tax=Scatophagus argus TaxID=75038 RepID=UPI001ED7F0C4|nr:doublecortin domain-containing protein 2-like isoform X5 [Scatophagus argus]